MKLIPVVFDFETFWSATHSLTCMNPIDYVTHKDTEIQSCSITVAGKPTIVVFGEEDITKAFAMLPWNRIYAIGHNMGEFDAMLIAWRLGLKPAMWGCTQAMARPRYDKVCGTSLAGLLKHLNSPFQKGSLDDVATKGKRLAEFTQHEIDKMREYNATDGDGCMWLFDVLRKQMTTKELRVIDMTIRMLVEPKFELDSPLLEAAQIRVKQIKRDALLGMALHLGIEADFDQTQEDVIENVRSTLASAPKFAALLEALGVEVPMKLSKAAFDKGIVKHIPALAKSDDAMIELCEHENEVVAAAAQTRLGVKSTMLESRIETLLMWGDRLHGQCPVPLRYAGAATTGRWSGTMKVNMQNPTRVERNRDGTVTGKPSNALRMCMRAPKGMKVIVADQSGIELRINHFLWKEPESMALYKRDAEADLYKAFAAARFGISVDDVDKIQRFLGKVAQLGLGFGSGAVTFAVVAKLLSGGQLVLDEAEALSVVNDWRSKYVKIVEGWAICHDALTEIYMGRSTAIDPWGLTQTTPEGILLPSGRVISYPGLHEEKRENKRGNEWWYGQGRSRARIYAGKVDENIVQALGRDTVSDNALEFKRRTGINPSLLVHDEIVCVVPEREAEALLNELQSIMRTPPKWWPELVVWSEGSIADTYGDAK